MPDATFADADFLPARPPRNAILDFSGSLTLDQTNQLEGVAHVLNYQAKVVVLPKNFTPGNFDQFSRDLAQHWQVSGNRLLLVIDLKGKHMQALPGKALQAKGVDSSFINKQVFPTSFVPSARENDVAGAIQSTLLSINEQVQSRAGQLVPSQGVPSAYPGHSRASQGDSGDNGWGVFVMLALVPLVIAVLSLMAFRKRAESNKQIKRELEEKSSLLYQIADQLGQASEYLPRDKQPELAQKVAEFFSKLSAVEQAKRELEMMERQSKTAQVRDGLLKIHKVVDLLREDAKQLLPEVNALTGGVQSFSPTDDTAGSILKNSETNKQREIDEGERLRLPSRGTSQPYYTPTWMSEPMYAPMMVNPFGGGVGGLMSMALLLNQMDMSHRLNDLAAAHQYQDHHPSNNWDNDSQNTSDSWGDEGGSWGGSDDWGGGGDFGGGGGDW
jgi:uncharacterized membrane protein YgcG